MTGTPIFDAVHHDMGSPSLYFKEPDGSLICYGVRIFVNGEPRNYALVMQGGKRQILDFPVLPAPWNGEPVVNDGC